MDGSQSRKTILAFITKRFILTINTVLLDKTMPGNKFQPNLALRSTRSKIGLK